MKHPLSEDLKLIGSSVSEFMRQARITTVWVREESHFGTTAFSRLKQGSLENLSLAKFLTLMRTLHDADPQRFPDFWRSLSEELFEE